MDEKEVKHIVAQNEALIKELARVSEKLSVEIGKRSVRYITKEELFYIIKGKGESATKEDAVDFYRAQVTTPSLDYLWKRRAERVNEVIRNGSGI